MYWNRVSVETTEEASDLISSVLMEAGASGVEIAGGSNPPQQEGEYPLVSDITDDIVVSAYYGEQGFDRILESIGDGIETLKHSSRIDLGTLLLQTDKVEDADWNESFKKNFKAFRAAERIVVKPTWDDFTAQEGDIVIEMDPGMAFGSGEHETTRMCLELIQKYMPEDAHVLDVGCGSGILGIACAKLGAKKILSLDNDPVSVDVTEKNARGNGVESLTARLSDLLSNADEEKYDIVLANIIADVIIRLNDSISRYLKPDSVYIISGIIKDRFGDVLSSLEHSGLKAVETLSMGDWRAVAAQL